MSASVKVPLDGEERADRATAAVLRALLEVVEANFAGTIADLDPEYLHDLRVSVRRSRAIQRELKGVFEPTTLREFRQEFRWLQRSTGEARDLDVHVEEFAAMGELVPDDLRPDLDQLLQLLRDRRERAHIDVVAVLSSDRTSSLLSSWRSYLAGLEQSSARERPDAKRPIAELAGERIRHVYRRTIRLGSEIAPDGPSEEYHELRKQGKELRYLLELFGAQLFPEEMVKPMIKTLKGVQDVLGRHQDREVQEAELRSLHQATSSNGAAVNPALVKLLLARLEADQLDTRAAFPARFQTLAGGEQQQLVKYAFR